MKLFVTYNNHNKPEDMPYPNKWDSEVGYQLIIARDKAHAASLADHWYKEEHIYEVDITKEAVIDIPFVSSDSPRED